MKRVLITQSNYIPWKGYFDSIQCCDVFVIFDEMQYTKMDWRNRNKIKTKEGLKWLTIPVQTSGKYHQKIRDTKVADKNWNITHWNIIKENYRNANNFKEMVDWIEPLYRNCNYGYLSEINIHFIKEINRFLGIETEIRFSSEFELHEERSQRLVNICKDLEGTDFYAGPAAQFYIDTAKFEREDIKLHWLDYTEYKQYPQLYPPFEHAVSILDLILNMGIDSRRHLKYMQCDCPS